MRYSKLFGKTNKAAKQYESVNATLLHKAGFIDQVMAGVYSYLPLGSRVLHKIEKIIREEMDKIANEVFMPSLSPLELWAKSGRLSTIDVLMKTTPANNISANKNNSEYMLNSTHEEIVTPLAYKMNQSYKDFPFALYQIQTKFRNEPRAKSGLLRCREFRMKDLYSFHTSEADLKRYYEVVKQQYWEVFKRVGLGEDTYLAVASGGSFTDDYSHEFQTRCDAGEDVLFHAKKAEMVYNREVAPSKAPEINDTEDMKPMEEVEGKGIVGVEALATYLKIPVDKTTKTIVFVNEKKQTVAAAVRGGYDIDPEKLKKVLKCKTIELADKETVMRVTGAEVGYAGILNLPKDVITVMDESMKGRRNFECGANKTHFHSINVNFGRDLQEPQNYYDIKVAKEGDFHPETGEKYEVFRAAEVGNIFPLYTKFSDAFGYKYVDEQGKPQTVYMGCYGIGSSRIMGVIVEKFHDERGIIWPESVAPYQVHLVGLDLKDEEVKKRAEALYEILTKKGIEVLFDDRENAAAGMKFSDADLIGIPVRLVVSKKTADKVEYRKRTEKDSEIISIEVLLNKI